MSELLLIKLAIQYLVDIQTTLNNISIFLKSSNMLTLDDKAKIDEVIRILNIKYKEILGK